MDAEKQPEGQNPESFRYPPMSAEDFADWLENFRAKMEACHATFGFTEEQWEALNKLSPKDPPTDPP